MTQINSKRHDTLNSIDVTNYNADIVNNLYIDHQWVQSCCILSCKSVWPAWSTLPNPRLFPYQLFLKITTHNLKSLSVQNQFNIACSFQALWHWKIQNFIMAEYNMLTILPNDETLDFGYLCSSINVTNIRTLQLWGWFVWGIKYFEWKLHKKIKIKNTHSKLHLWILQFEEILHGNKKYLALFVLFFASNSMQQTYLPETYIPKS